MAARKDVWQAQRTAADRPCNNAGVMMDLDRAIEMGQERAAVYVLSPVQGGYLYKGSCRNLRERLKDNRAGRVAHTKNLRPLQVVHMEYCNDFSEARKREIFLKSGKGREWLKARVAERQTQRT